MALSPRDTPAPAIADRPGREAGLSHDDHQAVRLWLRLLTCSTQIEQTIRSHLQAQFGTTLSRFDYLAQLSRFPEGLRMKTLSEYLMVTGGNVTGLTDQLVAEGWVERVADPNDRRSMIVRLTPRACASSTPWPRSTRSGWSSYSRRWVRPVRASSMRSSASCARCSTAPRTRAAAPDAGT